MNIERLTHLRDILLAHHDNGVKFDLCHWHHQGSDHHPGDECGTHACAIGLACLDPWFNKQGLYVFQEQPRYSYAAEGNRILRNWDAVTKFFDLSSKDAEYLFSALNYSTSAWRGASGASQVAARIQSYMGCWSI